MYNGNAHLLLQSTLDLGEGATWNAGWQRFMFVDIEGKLIGSVNPYSLETSWIPVAKKVGCVAPTNSHYILAALQGELKLIDPRTNKHISLAEFSEEPADSRCNEGKCDAEGRFWIGTMNIDAASEAGSLYSYNGVLHKMIEGLTVPNGLCWNEDNSVMYHIDTFQYNVMAYEFDLAAGRIKNPSVAFTIPASEGLPDGMAIDNEGKLWIAMWGGQSVNRYDPASGELLCKISVPAPNVTSCAFGGTNGELLFITTARSGLTRDVLDQYPLSGSLFIAETGIRGKPDHLFRVNLPGESNIENET